MRAMRSEAIGERDEQEGVEIKWEKGGQGRTGQGGKPAAGMFHMPVLWMTWPPWSVGDTGSN